MGCSYSFVEYPQMHYKVDVRYNASILKLPSKNTTYNEFIYKGDNVICICTKQTNYTDYTICKILYEILNRNDSMVATTGVTTTGVTTIEVRNNEFIVTYSNGNTDIFIKHINVGACYRDSNYYLIKVGETYDKNKNYCSSDDL